MERSAIFGADEVNIFGETGCEELKVAPEVHVPLHAACPDHERDSMDFSRFSELFDQTETSEVTLGRKRHDRRKNVENKTKDHIKLPRRKKEASAGHPGKLKDVKELQAPMEDCILRQGCQSSDAIIAAFQRRYESEVTHLESVIKRHKKDKERLKNSLIRAEIKISYLQVKMEALIKKILHQMLQHEREKNDLKKLLTQCHSYCRHRVVPERNVKTIPHNTLNSSWADQYQDSGLLLYTDAVGNASNECDCEDHQDILECVHQLLSTEGIQHLDPEMSHWKSDITCSLAPSTRGSVSLGSTRKLLSVFSRQTDADILDAEESVHIYRLVLAGDAGSGKSSFLLRLSMNEFRDDIQMTLGVDTHIKKMLVDGGKNLSTDLGYCWPKKASSALIRCYSGRFRSISRSYFRKAHGVFLLYDVTSQNSFLNIRKWMDQIKESIDDHTSVCVIGNKVDLRAELPEGTCVSSACGEKLAMTSAKEGTNVVEAVLHLAREIKKSAHLRQQLEPQMKLSQR